MGHARDHMRHLEQEDRDRESQAKPESKRHIPELGGLLLRVGVNILRLERHAADRTRARMILLDLRVHRANVCFRACLGSRGGGRGRYVAALIL